MGSYARGMLINCSSAWLRSHDIVGVSNLLCLRIYFSARAQVRTEGGRRPGFEATSRYETTGQAAPARQQGLH